ncbi:MAG: energy transducer TonB [Pirellulaceae bacterium]
MSPTITHAQRVTQGQPWSGEKVRAEGPLAAAGQPRSMVTPRVSTGDRRYGRYTLIGLAVSLIAHLGFAGWLVWRSEQSVETVSFAGQPQAIQLEATFVPPMPDQPAEPVEITIEPPAPSAAAPSTTALAKTSSASVEIVPTDPLAERKVAPPAGTVELVRQEVTSGEAQDQVEAEPASQPRRTQHQPPSIAAATIPPGTQVETPVDFSANPPPRFPPEALAQGWYGTVVLRIAISAAGQVEDVRVIRSSGYAILDQAAVEAVRQWRGLAATRGGRPVATVEVLPIRFMPKS